MKWYLIGALICISLIIREVEHFLYACWPCVCFLWRTIYSNPSYIWAPFGAVGHTQGCLGFTPGSMLRGHSCWYSGDHRFKELQLSDEISDSKQKEAVLLILGDTKIDNSKGFEPKMFSKFVGGLSILLCKRKTKQFPGIVAISNFAEKYVDKSKTVELLRLALLRYQHYCC